MTTSLRQLVASFTVEVDKAGALKQGNAQVEALKGALQGLEPIAKRVADGVGMAFKSSAQSIDAWTAAARRATQEAVKFSQLGVIQGMTGRSSVSGFAGLGALRDARRPIGQMLGPSRTHFEINNARTATAQAAQAAGGFKGVREALGGVFSAISPVALGIAGIGVAAVMATRAVVGLVNEMGGLVRKPLAWASPPTNSSG